MREQGEHDAALRFVSNFIGQFGLRSVLDVGGGTGRGVKYFLEHHPDLRSRGVEAVRALRDEGEHTHGISESTSGPGRPDHPTGLTGLRKS